MGRFVSQDGLKAVPYNSQDGLKAVPYNIRGVRRPVQHPRYCLG